MAIGNDVIESSRWGSFVFFVAYAALAALMWRIMLDGRGLLFFMLVAFGFSLFALHAAIEIFRPRRLNVTPEGFSVTPTIGAVKHKVLWSDVEGFQFHKIRNTFFFEVAYRTKGSHVSVPIGLWWQISAPELADYLEGCRNYAVGHVVADDPALDAAPLSSMGGLGVGLVMVAGLMAFGFIFPFMPGRRGAGPLIDWSGLEPKKQAVFIFIWALCAVIGLIGFIIQRAAAKPKQEP